MREPDDPALGPDSPESVDGSPGLHTSTFQVVKRTPGLLAWLSAGGLEWGALTFMAFALGIVIHQETQSALWVGLQVAALTLPYTFLSFSIGRSLDRFERRRLLLVAYSAEIVIAGIVGILAQVGMLAPWNILLASLAFGVLITFEVQANWMVIYDLAPKRLLTRVIALSSTVSNLAIAGCMVIGGTILVLFGMTYVCVAYILAATPVLIVIVRQPKTPPVGPDPDEQPSNGFDALRETITVARKKKPLGFALAIAPIVACLLLPVVQLLSPLSAWMGGNPFITGVLAGVAYLGCASVAPAMSAARRRQIRTSRIVVVALTGSACAMAIAGFVGQLLPDGGRIALAIPALFIIGVALTVLVVTLTSTIQTAAPDALRGHFLGLSGFMLDGLLPITAVLWGWAIDLIGFGYALGIGAILLALVTAYHRAKSHFQALDQVDPGVEP